MRVCPGCQAECVEHNSFCGVCGMDISGATPEAQRIAQTKDGLGPGSVVGAYRLHQLIGEGGMGYVYLAEHAKLGRRVALKMLRTEYAQDEKAVRRFFTEARLVNQIAHDNIVEITDFIEQENGRSYYIMELLKGSNLKELNRQEGVLPLSRSLHIAIQMASALGAVHDAGIIHRDLKPENVFLIERSGQQDFVKLLDFGVAKLMNKSAEGGIALDSSASGSIFGTPRYMSLEQASGKPVDHRADIYSFGVILYELVTGQRPVNADNFGALVVQLMTARPVRPSKQAGLPHEIPKALEALVMECLNIEPRDRPQRFSEIRERLKKVLADLSGTVELRPARKRANPIALTLLGVGITLLGIGGYAALRAQEPTIEPLAQIPPPPAPKAEVRTEVRVVFDSAPQGAKVRRVGEETALGRTPITLSFKRSATSMQVRFELEGFEVLEQEVSLDSDLRVNVALKPKAPAPKSQKIAPVPPKARPKKPLSERDIMDPFED